MLCAQAWPPQLEKNQVVPQSFQDEALARWSTPRDRKMEKLGRRVRSSQPRVKGALWTAYMRVNYKPFHKYKHISFTRPYNIAPHTHAHARARAHIIPVREVTRANTLRRGTLSTPRLAKRLWERQWERQWELRQGSGWWVL